MRAFIEETVDDILDSDGDVNIGTLSYSRSQVLKAVDPIAYREVCLEIVNSQIEDLQYELERLDPQLDAEEVRDLQERIAELENY